jgi:Xaa-Pro aminopeptidase
MKAVGVARDQCRAIAADCFKKHGVEKYFIHGIGHFLGLSTHDVADATQPLQVGDVITIEPGLYMPDEPLGIRIEDDFLITADGCECLSRQLPRTADDVENFFAQSAKL